MPLNSEKPVRKIDLGQKVGNIIKYVEYLISPNLVLGTFVLFSIILSLLQIGALGFHIVFALFVVSYFAERMVRFIQRAKKVRKRRNNEQSKQKDN